MIDSVTSTATDAVPIVQAGPDVVAAGQVLAQLNDWRAIMFGLMFVCALLLAALLTVVGLAFRAWMKASEAMSGVREAIAATNAIIQQLDARRRGGRRTAEPDT